MRKAIRMSITVPVELRARMEAVAKDVNWSAIASHAFEQKLAEIADRRDVSRGAGTFWINQFYCGGLSDGEDQGCRVEA